MFTINYVYTLNCVLRALKPRKHIYSILLQLDYNTIKERERIAKEDNGIVWCCICPFNKTLLTQENYDSPLLLGWQQFAPITMSI